MATTPPKDPKANTETVQAIQDTKPEDAKPEVIDAAQINAAQIRVVENKKCKVCNKPAVMYQSIAFFMDTGYGWVMDKVHLCETHAENLTEGEIDQLYVKQRMAHLSKTRINKSKPPIAPQSKRVATSKSKK